MKKIIALMIAVITALSLVACSGGVDKQPAIDAHNKAFAAIDSVSAVIQENPEDYDEAIVNAVNTIINEMVSDKELLESDQKITEEDMAKMIARYGEIETWITTVKEALDIE